MSNATINNKLQFVYYLGSGINISNIPTVSNISGIIGIGSDGVSPQSWSNGFPFNNLLGLNNGEGYLVSSKSNTSFPYNVYVENNSVITGVVLNKRLQIAEYRGSSKQLNSDSISLNFDSVIAIDSSGNPQSWTNGFPFSSLESIASGNTYLFYNKTGNLPFNLWPNDTVPITLTPSPTPTSSPTPTPTPTPDNTGDSYTLYGWGDNYYGQLGATGVPFNLGNGYSFPITGIYLDKTWKQVVASPSLSMGLDSNGHLYLWGQSVVSRPRVGNDTFKTIALGDGNTGLAISSDGSLYSITKTTSPPTRIGTSTNWEKISASLSIYDGYYVLAAINSDNELYVWGYGPNYQIGNGSSNSQTTPIQIGPANSWSKIVIGQDHTLAITTDGKLYAWGINSFGQLGDGTQSTRTIPTRIGLNSNWIDIAAGSKFSIALNSAGEIYTWGDNNEFCLGQGVMTMAAYCKTPQKLGIATNWIKVFASKAFSAAINDQNELYTWGNNASFNLGNFNLRDISQQALVQPCSVPHRVGSSTNWFDASLTDGNGMGLASGVSTVNNSGLFAFGNNAGGELGYGNTINQFFPQKIELVDDWDDISGSIVNNSISIRGGRLYGCGTNLIANGSITNSNAFLSNSLSNFDTRSFAAMSPVFDNFGTNWSRAYSSSKQILLINNSSELYSYALDGFNLTSFVAIPSSGSFNNWTDVSPGENHIIGISNNRLYAWGNNANGQLGTGTSATAFIGSPYLVTNASPAWIKVSANRNSSAAISYKNELYVCGYNGDGILGLNDKLNKTSWTQNSFNNLLWKDISLGYDHALGITTSGNLYAWGSNVYGQLGNETFDDKLVPILIGSKNDWVQVAAGQYCSFAMDSTGQIYSWGTNNDGRIGIGKTSAANAPTRIYILNEDGTKTYLNNCIKVATGGKHTFALRVAPNSSNTTITSYMSIESNNNIKLTVNAIAPGLSYEWYAALNNYAPGANDAKLQNLKTIGTAGSYIGRDTFASPSSGAYTQLTNNSTFSGVSTSVLTVSETASIQASNGIYKCVVKKNNTILKEVIVGTIHNVAIV